MGNSLGAFTYGPSDARAPKSNLCNREVSGVMNIEYESYHIHILEKRVCFDISKLDAICRVLFEELQRRLETDIEISSFYNSPSSLDL